jgi:hypothetical protein
MVTLSGFPRGTPPLPQAFESPLGLVEKPETGFRDLEEPGGPREAGSVAPFQPMAGLDSHPVQGPVKACEVDPHCK